MYEDIMQGRRGLAGIVVASDEDVVIANSYPSNDMMQDSFADDMLTSGDEGIGFVQARRLKRKLHSNRRRITETGYAVAGGTEYAFGDLGKIRISFKHPFGKHSLFRKATRLVGKVAPYAVGGIVGGTLLKKGLPALFKGAKGLLSRGGGGEEAAPEPVAVATTAPAGVPVPAPTGATDAVGTPIPASIQQAMTSGASPIPAAAPTASEDVAAQVQEDQTQNTMEAGVAGPFTMPNFSDPKVLLALGGVAFLIFSQMGHKGSHRRSRRR